MSNALASQDKIKYGISGDTIVPLGIQPKLGYRFLVRLDGFSSSVLDINSRTLTGHVISVTPPDFSQEEVPIDVYTSRYYVVGKHTIGDLTLELRNDIDGEVVEAIQRQIDKQYNAKDQSHAATAGEIKFTTNIMYLDGSNGGTNHPNIKEVFVCSGCWIKAVNWGQLQYSSNEPIAISVTIRPDNVYHIINRGGMSDGSGNIDLGKVLHSQSTVYHAAQKPKTE